MPNLDTVTCHVDGDDQDLWNDQDHGTILKHQLSALLTTKLRECDSPATQRVLTQTMLGERPSATIGCLFKFPNPPVELLELTKRYAKYMGTEDDLLPKDVAAVLHLCAICVAHVRCCRKITAWDDWTLRGKIRWAHQLPWLDEQTRGLLQHADRIVSNPSTNGI